MANTFATVQELSRRILPRLLENLVFPNLIFKDYSDEFQTGKGDTIKVKKPVVLKAEEFNEATGTSAQAVTQETVDVKLDHLATVDISIGALQASTEMPGYDEMFVEPAAIALAQKINDDGLALYKDLYTYAGTAAATISTLAGLAGVRKQLNVQKVPSALRSAVWDPTAEAALISLDAIVNAEKAGSTEALREASMGRVFGMDHYMTQSVQTHTKGTLAAGGTNGKITVKTAVTTAALKVTLDVTADANGTLTGTLVKGDILTIDGKTYVVTAACEAADNEVEVSIYPAITVAADKQVTVLGSHVANLAFHQMAFAFVNRPLLPPDGAMSYVTNNNGIGIRVVRDYDSKYKKHILSADVLYGFKTVYPELACRVLG